jgi:hypothetical protein
MSSRNERRHKQTKLRKGLGKRVGDPAVRRIALAELKRRKPTEVYRLDDGTGKPMFFNISEMRVWAAKNCETYAMPPDFDRAARLFESGAVEPDHIMNYTIHNRPEPIIVCRGLRNGDQIVDGAHRFAAMCAGAAMLKLDVPIPAYVLEPHEWLPFVISDEIAKACGFE